MKRVEPRIFWGILLIAGGALFLLENMGILALDNVWPIVFTLPAIVFLYVFLINRENWWAVIPGMSLLGIAALIAFDQLFPKASDTWGATIFMGSLALSFLAVYVRTATKEWWAVIPMGVLGTIALLVGFEPLLSEGVFAGLFMLGLGLTFTVVYLLPTPSGRMQWAIFPAGILGAIGLLTLTATTRLIGIIGPAAIIALGLYIIFRRSNVWE